MRKSCDRGELVPSGSYFRPLDSIEIHINNNVILEGLTGMAMQQSLRDFLPVTAMVTTSTQAIAWGAASLFDFQAST